MKKILISFFLLLFFLILSNSCFASSYKFTASANKTTVQPGDEVLITLDISDIDAGTEGINVVETTLLYDTSVFEEFNFIDKNDWKSTYNANTGSLYGKLLYTKMISGVKENQEIGKLQFKLKKDLPEMETQIKLLQVTSNDGYQLMNEGDRIITLKIVKDSDSTIPDKPIEPEEPDEPAKPDEPKEPEDTEDSKQPVIPDEPETPKNPEKPIEQETPSQKEEKPFIPETILGVQTGDFITVIVLVLIIIILLNIILFIYLKRKKKN